MLTLHINTTSRMIQCPLNMVDDSFNNCNKFCHSAGGQLQIKVCVPVIRV